MQLLNDYRAMRRIRRTEEKIVEIYHTDKVKSPVHLSIGQEALAVASMKALATDDVVFSNYRGHAHYLARGGSLQHMWAELYGKATGYSAGKAGSMHLMDMNVNFMIASAIVTSAIPNAVGYALAEKMNGSGNIVACYHGDGAVDEGVFWESLNFASLHNLPILFICENNRFAIYSHQFSRMKGDMITERARAFGLEAKRVEDMRFEAYEEGCKTAADYVRSGAGPCLIECMTYRWRDHVGPGDDHDRGFRNKEMLAKMVASDEVERLGKMLSDAEKVAIDAEVEIELAAALEFAETSPFPDESHLMSNTYA